MSAIGFRIKKTFQRPDRRLVDAFQGLPVANIDDCMNRTACLDSGIKPFNKAPLLGTAFTVRSTGGDNLMMHKALDMAQPGDIIVVSSEMNQLRASCGEIMVRYAMSRGIAGFIIDGCIRDADEIAEIDFPVYARGVTPNGPYKNGPGEINFPVSIGSVIINPGDILVGDGDGVIVIKPEDAEMLAEETRKVTAGEHKSLEDIAAGRGLNRDWVEKALSSKGCVYVD